MTDVSSDRPYQGYSDYSLEHITRTQIPSSPDHKKALAEIYRRKEERRIAAENRAREDRRIQVWILAVAAATLFITLYLLFR